LQALNTTFTFFGNHGHHNYFEKRCEKESPTHKPRCRQSINTSYYRYRESTRYHFSERI
jgi:hypothetical protein